jgi:hypothetical protein
VRIYQFKKAKDAKAGIVLYAETESRSNPLSRHLVTASRRGTGLTFRCDCTHRMFHPRAKCDHIKAVLRRAEKEGL